MFTSFKGVAFRSHDPRWSFEPTSGEGAKLTGGRYNPKGQKALYLSFSELGAIIESQHGFSKRLQPRLLCAYQIDVEKIIDLTDPQITQSLDIHPSKLGGDWLFSDEEPYTHTVFTQLINLGANGVIDRSYATNSDAGKNIILWQWNDNVSVIDDYNALPTNQNSWA